ncbi:MAG: kynureninase, partial [Cyclobacteriaceae bacterium]|nr:kynureninase [Cyclobacteriaceae bacterium]
HKILMEYDAFPSDRYAVESQVRFHGYDPQDSIIALKPRSGEYTLRMEDIEETIVTHGDSIALILLGNTNYYTGQLFDMAQIAKWGHQQGCVVGFDCAHAAGNVELSLHDSEVDFAVWCTYKYLNSGPGSLGGCFVHEKHAYSFDIPRFTGWWGHNKNTRFSMRDGFDPIPGVESWQLSNPPILSMASVWASLKVFDEAGIKRLREKSIKLTSYLEFLIDSWAHPAISMLTPRERHQRGCQLSIKLTNSGHELFKKLMDNGVITDWREPDVIRVAPVPLYNTFEEVYQSVEIFKKLLPHG